MQHTAGNLLLFIILIDLVPEGLMTQERPVQLITYSTANINDYQASQIIVSVSICISTGDRLFSFFFLFSVLFLFSFLFLFVLSLAYFLSFTLFSVLLFRQCRSIFIYQYLLSGRRGGKRKYRRVERSAIASGVARGGGGGKDATPPSPQRVIAFLFKHYQ